MCNKLLILLPVFYSAASLAASPIQYDVSASLSRDDNITRAQLDRDIAKDNIVSAGASARYKLAINDISYASFKAAFDVKEYMDFDKLSSTNLGLQASYHIRPTSGYTALRYFVQAAYQERMIDSDLRDGSATQVRIGLGKRLTDLISLRVAIDKEKVDANNRVFDGDSTRIYIDLDYRLTDNNKLYLTISSIDGDIVSTALPSAQIIAASSANVLDDAFLSLTQPTIAYKIDADTTAIRLGDVFTIDSMQAVDVSVYRYDADAYLGINYSGTIFDVTYVYRF